MHTLLELKDFLESKEIKVKSYSGWQLVVGNDTWGMLNDVYYCNNDPVPKKEILSRAQQSIEKENENVNQSIKARKWRGISSRNYRGNGNDLDD